MKNQIETEKALIPMALSNHSHPLLLSFLSVIMGVILISALAQIAIPLPWTPVPITGQTFGVAYASLLLGRRRAFAAMLTYLFLGGFGLPIFALGASGFLGPTTGYLLGMLAASYVMGFLADQGWTQTWSTTWLAAFLGSSVIFAFGLWGLSFFLSSKDLLSSGLIPFLPGDFIKTMTVCFLIRGGRRWI